MCPLTQWHYLGEGASYVIDKPSQNSQSCADLKASKQDRYFSRSYCIFSSSLYFFLDKIPIWRNVEEKTGEISFEIHSNVKFSHSRFFTPIQLKQTDIAPLPKMIINFALKITFLKFVKVF